MILLIAILAIIAIIIVVVVLATRGNSDDENVIKSRVFKTCKNNFDCSLGLYCELRDHPSDGICVIPPGGACHSANGDKTASCYSGYYCDLQDGTCLKKE